MTRRTDKGLFVPKNPQKYVGSNVNNITYRSSWERTVQNFLDTHPSVVAWSSECVSIPYFNPLKRRWSVYIPDFLVSFVDRDGKARVEMIEVKPLKEVPGAEALTEGMGKKVRLSRVDRLVQAINAAKWEAARKFCAKRNIHFRVMTEADLFRKPGRRPS
jgi:TnsA endonuclease N terminal